MNTIPNSTASLSRSSSTSAPLGFLRATLATELSWSPTVARVALGLVMLPHGLQKTVGAFGGHGFTGTMGFFTGSMGLPWLVALAVILAESVGALALVVGVGSRWAAAGIAAVMLGALATHTEHGFFMNWYGAQAGEGFEYHLLALALAAIVLISGGGKASVDRWLSER
jgi:putative oxidoreductase